MHKLTWFKAVKDQSTIFLSFCIDFAFMLTTNLWKASYKWQSDKIIEIENSCCCYSFWDTKYHVLNISNYLGVLSCKSISCTHLLFRSFHSKFSVCSLQMFKCLHFYLDQFAAFKHVGCFILAVLSSDVHVEWLNII